MLTISEPAGDPFCVVLGGSSERIAEETVSCRSESLAPDRLADRQRSTFGRAGADLPTAVHHFTGRLVDHHEMSLVAMELSETRSLASLTPTNASPILLAMSLVRWKTQANSL